MGRNNDNADIFRGANLNRAAGIIGHKIPRDNGSNIKTHYWNGVESTSNHLLEREKFYETARRQIGQTSVDEQVHLETLALEEY